MKLSTGRRRVSFTSPMESISPRSSDCDDTQTEYNVWSIEGIRQSKLRVLFGHSVSTMTMRVKRLSP